MIHDQAVSHQDFLTGNMRQLERSAPCIKYSLPHSDKMSARVHPTSVPAGQKVIDVSSTLLALYACMPCDRPANRLNYLLS